MSMLTLPDPPLLSDRFTALATRGIRPFGRITRLVGLTLECSAFPASVGDLVIIGDAAAGCHAEVVGFREQHLWLMPLGDTAGIRGGDRVQRVDDGLSIQVSAELVGRILDPLGRPLDGLPLPAGRRCRIRRAAPLALERQRVTEHFHTGIRSIDAALPMGCGQRVGIFAGSGVGKSSLLGMIVRNSRADVKVVALIGERGKEVRDFIEDNLGEEGLAQAVLVVATSDRPALERLKGAETAMTIAEHYRAAGANVLFIMDSLTRYAMAQREIGLAVGEPPATRGYPPSVFSCMPRLLERAGNDAHGTLTACYTVLVEADDLNDPVGDTARGLLDGHIVLSRELANRGHFPPVDISQSVSRVADAVSEPRHAALARRLRQVLAAGARATELADLGIFKPGSNPEFDEALALKPQVDAFLRQELLEPAPWQETFATLNQLFSP